jgi:hypothetical protein
MMKYLGLIAGWFLVAVVLLILLVVAAVVPIGDLTPGLLGKVFGVWLLVGLVGVALGGVVAYYKVKGLVKDLKEMAKDFESQETVGSSYLPVIKQTDAEQARKMAEDAHAQKLHKEMQEAGFVHEADYVMEEMHSLAFAGYVHPEKKLYGMVCVLPGKGTWAELSGDFEDGTNLFVSGLMQPLVMDTRPKVIRETQPGAGVTELLELFEKNKPGGAGAAMVEVRGNTFKKNFEAYWWIDKSWRRARGGTTLDELRRMKAAGVVGDEGTSDEDLRQALEIENQKWQEAWSQVPGQLIERYLKSAGVDEENDAYFDRQMKLVAAFEGQTVDEFTEYLAERLHNLHEQGQGEAGEMSSETTQSFRPSTFRPGADGYKLAAAAEGKANGLAGAAAASMKYPEWFKEVHAGDHPMRHVIYEVCQE